MHNCSHVAAGPEHSVPSVDGDHPYDGRLDAFELTAEYVRKSVGNRMLRMLAYNRSIPGPFIRVEQDSTIRIRFRNDTDLVQTVHSHGIRIDNRYDGVPGVTQAAVEPDSAQIGWA